MQNYQDQFPDFELDVAIPSGFVDTSFRNDICPSWTDAETGLQLFVDFKEPLDREFPESPRFTLHRADIVDGKTSLTDIILTESWSDVLKAIDAQRKRVLTQSHVRSIFDKHLNAALAEIQRFVGETDGGLASMYGASWDEIVASSEFEARRYLKAQCEDVGWHYDVNG